MSQFYALLWKFYSWDHRSHYGLECQSLSLLQAVFWLQSQLHRLYCNHASTMGCAVLCSHMFLGCCMLVCHDWAVPCHSPLSVGYFALLHAQHMVLWLRSLLWPQVRWMGSGHCWDQWRRWGGETLWIRRRSYCRLCSLVSRGWGCRAGRQWWFCTDFGQRKWLSNSLFIDFSKISDKAYSSIFFWCYKWWWHPFQLGLNP